MPSLDDALRATLRGRAEALPTPVDPWPGVAARARSRRRRRAAGSVVGTALAVLVVVGAASLSSHSADPRPQQVATTAPTASSVAPPTPPVGAPPANVVDWPARGSAVPVQFVRTALSAYAGPRHVAPSSVQERVLVTGQGPAGAYLLAQLWVAGDVAADTVAFTGSDEDLSVGLARQLGPDPDAVGMAVGSRLVVVPRPGTGQVLYAAGPGLDLRPVGNDDPALDGVAIFERPDAAARSGKDVVRLLDGDGRPIVTEKVFDLLCGKTSCG